MKSFTAASTAALLALAHTTHANTYGGSEVSAWSTLFDAIGKNVREDGKPDFLKCRGTREDPCKCGNNNPGFVCSGADGALRTILEVSFSDNKFETADKLFPEEEVEAFLQAVNTVTVMELIGDTDGLGDSSQGCLNIPSCATINCDFSPRTLCEAENSTSTFAPTTSPTEIQVGEGELTVPPTNAPTNSPTTAVTVNQADAWLQLYEALGHIKRENGNPDWLACRGVSDKPCVCLDKDVDGVPVDVTVTCSDVNPNEPTSGTITAIEFGDNSFTTANNTFPAEEVNHLLGIGTITTFRLSGNVAGLGDETQGCVYVPRCHNDGISCDFSPRELCGKPTASPTSSPVTAPLGGATPTSSPEIPTDDITPAPTGAPTAPTTSPTPIPSVSPTQSPTRIVQEEAWPILFDSVAFVTREDGKPDWNKCRGTRDDPCNCENNNPGFQCNEAGEIETVFFSENGLSNNGSFPVEAVNTFLGLASIKNITILGDTAGLGGSEQGCLQIINCHARDIVCNFAPRELCAAPTSSPTSSPNTPVPTSTPTSSPTTVPTTSPTNAGTLELRSEEPTTVPPTTTGSASRVAFEFSVAVVVVFCVSML